MPTFGVMLVLGVLIGSYVSAKLRCEFGEHVLGAVMMGFGGVTALGCSIGNGVTGLAWLSTGSILAVAGISGGAWLACGGRGRGCCSRFPRDPRRPSRLPSVIPGTLSVIPGLTRDPRGEAAP